MARLPRRQYVYTYPTEAGSQRGRRRERHCAAQKPDQNRSGIFRPRGSLWGLISREHTLDLLTAEQRRVTAADWAAAAKAIAAPSGAKAETSRAQGAVRIA